MPIINHVTVTTTEKTRVLTHENGQKYTLRRRDLIKADVSFAGAQQQRDGKFHYVYTVNNRGEEPINQIWFNTSSLPAIWFDDDGIKKGETKAVTFESEYSPKPTKVFMRTITAGSLVNELEHNEVALDTNSELFAAIDQVTDAANDSVQISVIGPLE